MQDSVFGPNCSKLQRDLGCLGIHESHIILRNLILDVAGFFFQTK